MVNAVNLTDSRSPLRQPLGRPVRDYLVRRLTINVGRTCGPDRRKVKGTTFAFCLLASCLVSKSMSCVVAATVPAASVVTFPEVGKQLLSTWSSGPLQEPFKW